MTRKPLCCCLGIPIGRLVGILGDAKTKFIAQRKIILGVFIAALGCLRVPVNRLLTILQNTPGKLIASPEGILRSG